MPPNIDSILRSRLCSRPVSAALELTLRLLTRPEADMRDPSVVSGLIADIGYAALGVVDRVADVREVVAHGFAAHDWRRSDVPVQRQVGAKTLRDMIVEYLRAHPGEQSMEAVRASVTAQYGEYSAVAYSRAIADEALFTRDHPDSSRTPIQIQLKTGALAMQDRMGTLGDCLAKETALAERRRFLLSGWRRAAVKIRNQMHGVIVGLEAQAKAATAARDAAIDQRRELSVKVQQLEVALAEERAKLETSERQRKQATADVAKARRSHAAAEALAVSGYQWAVAFDAYMNFMKLVATTITADGGAGPGAITAVEVSKRPMVFDKLGKAALALAAALRDWTKVQQ